MLDFFLRFIHLFIWKAKGQRRESERGEREIFSLLVDSLNSCKSQGWATPKPGGRSSIQVFCKVAGKYLSYRLLRPRYSHRKLDKKQRQDWIPDTLIRNSGILGEGLTCCATTLALSVCLTRAWKYVWHERISQLAPQLTHKASVKWISTDTCSAQGLCGWDLDQPWWWRQEDEQQLLNTEMPARK